MADVKISGLTAVSAVEANDLLEVSEDTGGGTYASRKATATQIKAFASADSVQKSGDTMTGPLVVNVSSASDALRITQTGAGNALVVEDSASPDATPFVVAANGNVAVGAPSVFAKFQVAAGALGQVVVAFNGTSVNFTDVDTNVFRSAAGLEGMRIAASGNVGIGTSSPVTRMTVAGDAVAPATQPFGDFQSNGQFFVVGATNIDKRLALGVDTASATMSGVIQAIESGTATRNLLLNPSGGNVGIGTSSPQNRLQVNGSFGRGAPVTKTGSFTLANTENWIICNGTGSITVTFPAASSWTGREVMIKTIAAQTVVSASSDVVPLAGGAAGTAILSATAGAWATLVSDGTNWIIMQA